MNDAYDKYEKHGCIHWKYYQQKHPLYYPIVKEVKNLIKRDSSVLDIGCGDGLISHILAQKRCEVKGYDINVEGIKVAKKKTMQEEYLIKPQFECKSFEEIEEKRKYNYAIAIDVIEHVENVKALLSKIKKYGEKFIIGTPEKEKGKIHRFHVKEYSLKEMQDLLKKFFKTVQSRRIELSIRGSRRQYLICWGS
jgi:2-polyprenyl-3-methyl-5-hydroxy-6-metoxy-1,4-benzoquinol methylase